MKTTNEFFLMHKDIRVCLMNINNDGVITNVRRIDENSNHFPLGGEMNDMKFYDWWKDRAIPKTRHGSIAALNKLGYSSTNSLLVNNLALSLNDCYWIKPRNENLNWEDVSLFKNDFQDTFGELTFNSSYNFNLKGKTKFDIATSQGELQKKWCIDSKKKRFLVKGNYGDSYQQSLNEVFASNLHFQLGFKNYVEYKLIDIDIEGNRKGIGCYSYNFCNEEVESISAWEILQLTKIKKDESLYYPFKNLCLKLGIKEKEFDDFLDYQILTDFLLTNTDRHMNNISLLRNPDTLEFIGFAPIYDSGNSMFYNLSLNELKKLNLNTIETHSFVKKETKLLKYVINPNAIDLNSINPDFSIYEKDIEERKDRIPYLKALFEEKINTIKSLQEGKQIFKR